MQILQITDTHLYGNAGGKLRGVETDPSLHAALDAAFARVPEYEAVLVTGDLVQDDKAGYLRFRSHFGGLAKPVLCIPGNHDEPEAMRRELTGEPFQICGAHEIGEWNFVMLDSYDPGHVGGRLTKNELARLDAALAQSAKHAMVCLHHQPIVMGSRWLDGVGLADARRILERHRPRMRMFARLRGAMFTRHSTARAAMCGCLRLRPPGRNFCRKAIVMRSTRVRRPTGPSNCMTMGVSTQRCTG